MKKVFKRMVSLLLIAVMVFGSTSVMLNPAKAASPDCGPYSDSYKSSKYYKNLKSIKFGKSQRENFVVVALTQLGYREGASYGDFSGAVTGSYNNYCEYNYWYHNKVSSGMPIGGSGAPWCATFVSWCARQAGIPTSILKNSIAAGHGPKYFNLNYYAGGAQKSDGPGFMGNYYTPKPGDLFYKSDWGHVGIVVSVDGSYFTTIEGNTNNNGSSQGNGVYSLRRKISDCYFGVPNYASGNYVPDSSNQSANAEQKESIKDTIGKPGYVILDEIKNNLNTYKPGKYKVTAKSGLFVRSGAGTSYDKIGGLSNGTVVTVTETKGQWGKYGGGWICLEYAELVSSGGGGSSSGGSSSGGSSGGTSGGASGGAIGGIVGTISSSSYGTGYYTVTTPAGLNVRSGPSTGYSKVGGFSKGTKVAITEVSGQWGKCDKGWIYLYYTSYSGPLEPIVKVPASPSLSRTSSANAAQGSNFTVAWSPAADAEVYDVYLKNSSGAVCQQILGTSGNSAVFKVNETGTYYVTAYSKNSKYTSSVSNTVSATFHAPSIVTFVDWDGTALSTQIVNYGNSATVPSNPSRYGWTFEKWSGNYNSVTENRKVTAVYKRNVYNVSFVDESGRLIGSKQKVEFEGAATAPDYTAPEGYTFLGWDKKFDYIESNLTVNPINAWTNEDLPVSILTSTTAVREKTGYTVNVKVRNNPNKETDGRVIVALKTDSGKLLTMTESAAFHLKTSADKTIEVFMPYDKAATVAEVYVVETFSTAIPISAVLSKQIDQGTAWTNWSTSPNPTDAYQAESRQEYRYRTKSTTSSSSSSLSGWTKYNTTWAWGNYGSWSGWTDSYIASSDSRQVETRQVVATNGYTEYRYGSYYNGSKSYFCPCHISGEWLRYTPWSTTRHTPTKYSAWYCPNNGYYDNYTINGLNYYWEESRYIEPTYKTQYRYRDRSKVYTYFYEKWSDWSSWSTNAISATSTRQVETRTVYRYLANDPSLVADTSGVERTITGKVDKSLAGEQATLFIYKVTEASDFTNEYVGQTIIGNDGSYSFTFKLREEPTVKTGDYTVTLGVEGTSAAIYLDPIKSPKPEYTVTYIDWDGTVLETQTVTDGENAVLPQTNPTREGYDFICWNNTATNVKDDMTVSPVYRIKEYTVVFVDWAKETVEMEKYEHGQLLAAPALEDTVDKAVVGWDAVLDGTTTVTKDMIVTAKYEDKEFTIQILDADNSVLESQTVVYGESVDLPESLSDENAVILGWAYDSSILNVTEDQIIVPVYYFKDTTPNPVVSIESGEYDSAQTVTFSCEDENAVIYYTTDGQNPLDFGTEYTGEFTIDFSCELKFAASSLGKNDSETFSRLIAVNDGINEDMHIVNFCGQSWDKTQSIMVKHGDLISFESSDLTMKGHTFGGVYTDNEFTTAWNLETDTVMSSMDLYFKWDAEVYDITFIGFEDEVLSEQSVEFGEVPQIPDMPKIDGYIFCGFDKAVLPASEDITYTANYVSEDEYVKVTLNKTKYRIFKGTSTTLIATLTPADVENSEVVWKSSDENIATVDDSGFVTGVSSGTVEISAISTVTGHSATCVITVMSNIDDEITLVGNAEIGFDSEGQLRGISVENNTVKAVSLQFENQSLEFTDINGNVLTDNDLVGTGTIIKLVNGDKVVDEVIVVVTGDYNGDGKINNRDAAMISRYLVDKEVASLAQLTAIDVNGDGYVNNRDASMVSRYLVGKEKI